MGKTDKYTTSSNLKVVEVCTDFQSGQFRRNIEKHFY